MEELQFVNLHTHSDYSLLDGASQLPQLIERAKELDMKAIALTDHGVMYGAIELIKVCRSRGVKAIIGNEMYVENTTIVTTKRGKKSPHHQVVLAKNTQGYKNLVKLTTKAHLEGMQGSGIFQRPCIKKEWLEQYHEGLIVTSGCLAGEVPRLVLREDIEQAKKVAQYYQNLFGDDYYLEIQDHGNWEDRIVNIGIVKIAKELNIKIVATNDSHFTYCTDVEAHDALLCIQTQQIVFDEKRLRYSGTEYLKSAQQMAELFRDHLPDDVIKEAIVNTVEVAEKVQSYNIMGEPRLPNYPIPSGYTADTYVEEQTWKGLMERFNAKTRAEIKTEYKERLEYELKMIQKMGFSTYFLVVWDYIKFARDKGIPVGPGRGSAAGSLVAYALKITNIDPVHHGLLFERFLNPERKSMPDIDTDFCIERRDEVIKYVTQRYGESHVAQIITFNRMTSKAVLKDVARVLGIPYSESDRMAKMIPVARGKPEKLKNMIAETTPEPEFKHTYETKSYEIKDHNDKLITTVTAKQWIDMAMCIEGTNKTYGVHAAGVVISSEPLDEIVPLQKNNEGAVITQYFMEDLESLGLLKMDFLGLKNLTMIQKTIDLIKQTRHQEIDPYQLPAEERRYQEILAKGITKKRPQDINETYKTLEDAKLEGIFQLESSGMREVVKDLKPSSIEDISSILALYRPGPLDAGLIPKFIARKHGREEISYEHPLLESILNETYGILVYQEQIMKVAQDLAGYSLGEADLLRRAMGKKKADEMNKQRETFIDGATKKGIHHKIADSLFDQMVKFAEYCFNKSHSTAYAYVTYQTAYLKANYPTEYMAALLSANSDDQDKVKKYLANCQNMGIEVEPPNINRSDVEFTPNNRNILFGLSAIKTVGQEAIKTILQARETGGEFKSLADLCERIDLRAVNNRTLDSLIKCGALDCINPNRQQLTKDLELVIKWAQKKEKERESGQFSLFDLLGTSQERKEFEQAPTASKVDDFTQKDKLKFEKDLLGLYVSDHPLKNILTKADDFEPKLISLHQLPEKKRGNKVQVVVLLTEIKKINSKKDNRAMAFLQMEDLEGQTEAVVFPDTYEQFKDLLLPEEPILILGKVDMKDDKYQLIVEKMDKIDTEVLLAPKPITNSEETGDLEMEEDAKNNGNNHLLTKEEEKVQEKKEDCYREIVLLEFSLQEVQDPEKMGNLKSLVGEYSDEKSPQKVPVMATIIDGEKRKDVLFGDNHWVHEHNIFVERLNSGGFKASIFLCQGV